MNAAAFITHVLYLDEKDDVQVSILAQEFTEASPTNTIRLLPQTKTFSYVEETSAPQADQSIFTITQLHTILAELTIDIDDAFDALGLETPASVDTLTPESLSTFVRTAVQKGLATAVAAELPKTHSEIQILPLPTHINTHTFPNSTSISPIETLDGMSRKELLTGEARALQALFTLVQSRHLTEITNFTEWCKAENIWPADDRFNKDARPVIAAKILDLLEHPKKFAAGLHESVHAENAA